jgi:hypothetical protein
MREDGDVRMGDEDKALSRVALRSLRFAEVNISIRFRSSNLRSESFVLEPDPLISRHATKPRDKWIRILSTYIAQPEHS